MPIYEFKCARCDFKFERIQKENSVSPPCPKCGFGTYRLISSGSFKLLGEGFYKKGMN